MATKHDRWGKLVCTCADIPMRNFIDGSTQVHEDTGRWSWVCNACTGRVMQTEATTGPLFKGAKS